MSSPLPSKRQILKSTATLNPHPEHVRDERFVREVFFDADDLLQVKYEMLRRVQTDGWTVTQAAAAFGFSRPAFYQAQTAFEHGGLAQLIPQKRGPKSAHKLSETIMTFLHTTLENEPGLPAKVLAERLVQHCGLVVHPRSIERALLRQEKKQLL